MQKKEEGGVKPLWVKCGCGKWNAVQVGAVVKYLEKVLSPTPARPAKPTKDDAPRDDS